MDFERTKKYLFLAESAWTLGKLYIMLVQTFIQKPSEISHLPRTKLIFVLNISDNLT